MAESILTVTGLKKHFRGTARVFGKGGSRIRALDGVSFSVHAEETFGVVGESGCGKSTLGKTILGIYGPTAGSVTFQGMEITGLSRKAAAKVRKHIQYVYQDPGSSLDPHWKVRRILSEPLMVHTDLSRKAIAERVENMMEAVGLNREQLSLYPHEFSGGQQRRLGLARILCLNPTLVILDEPTSGLDVSVQATILKLFLDLKERFRLTYIFVSHNLGVVRMMCRRTAVMYAGQIVEMGITRDIFEDPIHPYTRILIAAIPEIGKPMEKDFMLEGEPPDPAGYPLGCRFWPRCNRRKERCRTMAPEIRPAGPERMVSCHLEE